MCFEILVDVVFMCIIFVLLFISTGYHPWNYLLTRNVRLHDSRKFLYKNFFEYAFYRGHMLGKLSRIHLISVFENFSKSNIFENIFFENTLCKIFENVSYVYFQKFFQCSMFREYFFFENILCKNFSRMLVLKVFENSSLSKVSRTSLSRTHVVIFSRIFLMGVFEKFYKSNILEEHFFENTLSKIFENVHHVYFSKNFPVFKFRDSSCDVFFRKSCIVIIM